MNLERLESRRWLNRLDRTTEALFGIIVALTFTGSLSVLNAGRGDVRDMSQAALACNLAWGVVDGCFYVMGAITERGRRLELGATSSPSRCWVSADGGRPTTPASGCCAPSFTSCSSASSWSPSPLP